MMGGPAPRLHFLSTPEGLSFRPGASCLLLRRLRQGVDSRGLSEENCTDHIITYSGAAGG